MIALWLQLALAAEPAGIPVDRAVEHAEIGLSLSGMTRSDLTFSKDYVNGWGQLRDVWRLPGIERVLHDPLLVPGDAAGLAQRLHADDTAALVLAVAPDASAVQVDDSSDCSLRAKPALRAPICRALSQIAAIEARRAALLKPVDDAVIEGILNGRDPETEAQTPFTEAARGIEHRLSVARQVDPAELHGLALALAQTADQLRTAVDALAERDWPKRTLHAEVDGQRLIIGGRQPMAALDGALWSVDVTDAVLVVDPSGDEMWTGTPTATSIHLDLDGDDVWAGTSGAIRSLNVAIDARGDDTWMAQEVGPAGAIFGASIVLDAAGNDTYQGDSWSQGSAEHGLAILADLSGNDRYRAAVRGQGYAGVQGIGALYDEQGDDIYRIGGVYTGVPHYPTRTHGMGQGMSMGIRPLAAGGLAILHDADGDDHYTADLFSQGVSYWLGRGYLVDSAGDDVYAAHHYAQGSGIHLGVGALLDGSGDDRYSMHGLGLGSAHDYGVGWLVDGAGDDFVTHQDDSGVLGVGITNGVGVAVDLQGDDWRPIEAGRRGSYVRGAWGASVLVDADGRDSHHPYPAFDRVDRPSAASVVVNLRTAEDLPYTPDPSALPEPLVLATEGAPFLHPDLGDLGDRADAACAPGATLDDAKAWIALLPVLERDHMSDGYCLAAALNELVDDNSDAIRAAVVDAAQPVERLSGRWYARWLARLGPHPSNDDAFERLAQSPHPMVRKEVPLALASLEQDSALLDNLAADPDVTVRAATLHALDRLDVVPDRVAPALRDSFAAVRFNAAAAIQSHPDRKAAAAAVLAEWDAAPSAARSTMVYLLADLEELGSVDVDSQDPMLTWHAEQARSGVRIKWVPEP